MQIAELDMQFDSEVSDHKGFNKIMHLFQM